MTLILAAAGLLLTYLAHSTVLLGGAALLTAFRLVRSPAARDTLWKVALLGGLLTTTTQFVLGISPYAGRVLFAPQGSTPMLDVARERLVRADVPPAGSAFGAHGPSAVASTWDGSAAAAPDGGSTSARASVSANATGARAPQGAPAAERRAFTFRSITTLLSGVHVAWPTALLQLWLFGAMALAMRLVVTRAGLLGLLRSRLTLESGPLVSMLEELRIEAGVKRPVRLSVSTDLPGPIALCSREICLPARVLEGLSPAEQRAVLAHELGHVVRRDPAWIVTALLVETVFFLQPLNRLGRRRIQEAAEYLCDDWAASRTGGGLTLARCLEKVAGWLRVEAPALPAAGMAHSRSQLVSRVQRLLDGGRPAPAAAPLTRFVATVAGLAFVAWAAPGVATGHLKPAPQEEPAAEASDQDEWAGVKLAAYVPLVTGEGWLSVREDGRLIVLHHGYGVRLRGSGRIGFRQWGRGLVVPEGHWVEVDGERVVSDLVVCEESQAIRIVGPGGEVAWVLEPVRLEGAPDYREHDAYTGYAVREAVRRARLEAELAMAQLAPVVPEVDADLGIVIDPDVDVEVKLDAVLDSLMDIWTRDQEAVQAAARRLARRYERELRTQFESLGVELGRTIAPELERSTSRISRDLGPALERMGAELGRTLLESLADPDRAPRVKKKQRR
jgi:beta-lactamase regulating signal transducer with metallopeptidase domain